MPKTYLADKAYTVLKDRILRCEYVPGSYLNEEQLVADLNVSRTPIRSALVRLEQEHLLKIVSKRGIYITDISYEQVHDIYECRCLMETFAIRNYGNRFTKPALQSFLQEFHTPQQDAWVFYQQDNIFHRQVVRLCDNALLDDYYASIQSLSLRISACSGMVEDRVARSNDEHVAIINALLKDDYKYAEQLLLEHLNAAKQAAYDLLEGGALKKVIEK